MKFENLDEVKVNWIATAVFGVVAFAAVSLEFLHGVQAVLSLGLFVAGVVAMAATLVIGAGRSRRELITVGGLFFVAESGPKSVQRQFIAALVAQTAIGIASAAMRPYVDGMPDTGAAFAVLVPVFGLGLAGLWGARHGTFPERPIP